MRREAELTLYLNVHEGDAEMLLSEAPLIVSIVMP